jgi:spoIIIJ-associated protein
MDTNNAILEITKTIVDMMIDNASVEVNEESGIYKIFIQAGEDAPAIIGRHGDTIRSLQKIVEVACYHKLQTRVDIVVNVNDYREKQIERLQNISSEIAEKVKSGGHALPFRGLNSYERRVVHEYITKNHPELSTYSVGEGRARELMIDLQSSGQLAYNDQQEYAKTENTGDSN